MSEFAFDVNVRTVARVQAATVQEAIAKLAALENFDLGHKEGDVILTEGTAEASKAECFEIDGANVHEADPCCCHCNEPLRLVGGRWLDESDEHSELCGGRGPGEFHEPRKMFQCFNCGHTDWEEEFIPSDGRPDEYCCPECEATNVEAVRSF
jgi:hypothetical protein